MSDFIINDGILKKYTGNGEDVVIPEGVTSINSFAFEGCSSLMNIVFPEGVTRIGLWAFRGCSSLTSITIPESVTSIGNDAFEGTKWLEKQGAFAIVNGILIKYQANATHVIVPEGVTKIGEGAFEGCENLESVVLPEGITGIEGDAFRECRSLKNVVLPQSVNRIGDRAFSECESITEIVLPEGVTDVGAWAFSFNSSLKRIVFPNSLVNIGKYAFQECSSVTEVVLPEGLQTIEEFAFSYCPELKSVIIPSGIASIGNLAFAFCENLTSIITGTKLTAKVFGKTKLTRPIITNDIGMLPNTLKPYAAIGFAENPDDLKSARGKSHMKYIKASAATLMDTALNHMGLLRLMLSNKLLTPETTEAYIVSAQAQRHTEAISMLLDYQQNKLTNEDKQKAADKAEAREEKITEFVFGTENTERLRGRVFVVTGKLKTFSSRDEFKACLDACGAVLSETLNEQTNYLITNTPNSGTAKNKKAEELGVKKLTEDEFNKLIGRAQK